MFLKKKEIMNELYALRRSITELRNRVEEVEVNEDRADEVQKRRLKRLEREEKAEAKRVKIMRDVFDSDEGFARWVEATNATKFVTVAPTTRHPAEIF